MMRMLPVLCVALVLAACGTDDGVEGESSLPAAATTPATSPADTADTMTAERRQRAVSESGLPGARGIGGALDAQDAAERRNAAHDSMQ